MGPNGESHIIEHEEEKDRTMSKAYTPLQLEAAAKMARTADSLNDILKESGEEIQVDWSLFTPGASSAEESRTLMTGSPLYGGVVIRRDTF